MESLRFFIRFLSFHRKIVIGFFLLIAVVLFLTYGLDYLPRFSGNRLVNERGGGNSVSNDSRSDADPSHQLAGGAEGVSNLESQREDFSTMEDVGQLIELLKRFRAEFAQGQTSSVRLLFTRQSIKVARRLFELDLNQEQQRYVTQLMADALLMGCLVSLEAQYPVDQLEQELFNEVETMQASQDPTIRSTGACLMVTYKVASFSIVTTDERFESAKRAIETELNRFDLTAGSVENLCRFLLAIKRPFQERERAIALLNLISQRLSDDKSSEIREMGKVFTQTLYFDSLYLSELSDLLRQGKTGPVEQVDQLFQGLVKYPDTPIPLYQLALDCIRSEINVESFDRATELISLLESQAISQVSDANIQAAIQQALGELKEFIR